MRIKNDLLFHVERKRVVYVMTKTFRIRNNYTLDHAIKYSKKYALSLHIYVVKPYEENPKSKRFYDENTVDLVDKLKVICHNVSYISRDEILHIISQDIQAIFIDFAYLKFDIDVFNRIKEVAEVASINLFQVESNVFVPVRDASDHLEYGAYTIRHKINLLLKVYDEEVLTEAEMCIGELRAREKVHQFVDKKLNHYIERNDPSKDYTSKLSAFLKYGFISPVTVYHMLNGIDNDKKSKFLDELIIRRELAYNFVYYNRRYDQFDYMTDQWAYQTMKDHLNDERSYIYDLEDYIQFKTHDPYFNAAMKEMVYLGYMHGYMRMYWAKKIIEWSGSYKEAYDITIKLNNRYFIDGLTPNGYAGVAWCYGKHDHAWKERAIFGKLRYMNDKGLTRKFDIEQYVINMNALEKEK